MTYTRLQNYTNMVVGEHGIQTFEGEVVVLFLLLLSIDVLVPTSAHPLLFLNKTFVQIYYNCKLVKFQQTIKTLFMVYHIDIHVDLSSMLIQLGP